MSANPEFEALLFDVFGTAVDWKGSLTARCEKFGAQRGLKADWSSLVIEWESLYPGAIAPVREGARLWANLDELYRETLDALLPKYGLNTLSDEDRGFLVHGWHRLDPWPGTASGLERLKQRYIVAPLSNGTVRELANIAKHAGLPWDIVLGADIFRTYKPAPELYRAAVALVGSPAERIMLVAAHNNDLQAAQRAGMRTAFIRRPTEDPEPTGRYDFVAHDFLDLAAQLGA